MAGGCCSEDFHLLLRIARHERVLIIFQIAMYGAAVRCKALSSICRLAVLHQCIRPLDSNACGAFDAAEQVVAEQRLGIAFRCMMAGDGRRFVHDYWRRQSRANSSLPGNPC
jgi:hypothetical protein